MVLADEPLFRRQSLLADCLIGMNDRAGRIEMANDAALAAMGLSSSDVVGLNWRDFTPPERWEAEQTMIDQVWHSGKPLYMSAPRRHKAGHLTHHVVRLSLARMQNSLPLLLREAYTIDLSEVRSLADPGSAAQDHPHPSIAGQLAALRDLASRNDDVLLAYVLNMARLSAIERPFAGVGPLADPGESFC